jgi:hypothetical protein
MEKLGKIITSAAAVVLAYEVGKFTGAAISMKQTLRKSPDLEKVTCKFGNSEFTIYQSKKVTAKK